MLHIKTILILCLTGLSAPALAQNGGTAGSFSRIGFGPRGMAMGNALVSVSQEGIYSYYNPAVAALSPKGHQIDLATAAMSFDRSFNTLNGSFRLPPTAGITVAVMNAKVTDIDGRTTDGYHTGSLKTQEYQLATTLGLQISNKFSAGIGLKYYIADYHTDLSTASTLGLDLGLLYTISDNFQAGFSVQDLLASYNWNSSTLFGDEASARIDNFPTRYNFGLSYFGIQGLIISLTSTHSQHKSGFFQQLQLGSSYQLHKRLTLRAGWQIEDLSSISRTSHASAGFSIHLPFDLLSPSVDYAFVQEGNNISYMHSFGLRFNL
jgi:hypothetical protein